ncbi:lysophospholipase L1-like esterase [Sinorhizobium fredii]
MLLRAKGLNVNVVNAGKNGDTTKRMARRLRKVLTPDTVLVILQPGSNDARKGQGHRTDQNIKRMQQKLTQRGIKTLVISSGFIRSFPNGPDGLHLTADGYHQVAVALLPQVMELLRRK